MVRFFLIVVFGLAAARTAACSDADPRTAVPAVAKHDANGARKFLRGEGLGDDFWVKFRNNRPIDNEEREPLLRMLYWLGRFDPFDVERWTQPWGESPRPGEIYRLTGRLKDLRRLDTPSELAERFGLSHYYRCEVRLSSGDRPAVVYAAKVPRAWPEGGKAGTRIGAEAMFLKYAASQPTSALPHPSPAPPHSNPLPKGEETSTYPAFAAERLAWYPPTPLGDLGFDYGLFDDVEQNQPYNLRREREPFYSMLWAVGRAKPGVIRAAAGKIPLRFNPDRELGKPFVVKGVARSVEMIRLGQGDRDVIERFHIDHYYQIMLYTDESGDIPITVCVRQLPPGLPEGSGSDYAETLQAAGFFYKVWRYKILGNRPWYSPLLIGREPVWYPPPKPPKKTATALIIGIIFISLFVAIWVIAWRMNRGDRRFFQSLKDRRSEPDDVILSEVKDLPQPDSSSRPE